MISRLLSTTLLVLLSGGAFFAQATFATSSDDDMFLVFGVLCLGLSVANWFVWGTIREGWNQGRGAAKDGPGLPAMASFGPLYIESVLHTLGWPEPAKSEEAPTERFDR